MNRDNKHPSLNLAPTMHSVNQIILSPIQQAVHDYCRLVIGKLEAGTTQSTTLASLEQLAQLAQMPDVYRLLLDPISTHAFWRTQLLKSVNCLYPNEPHGFGHVKSYYKATVTPLHQLLGVYWYTNHLKQPFAIPSDAKYHEAGNSLVAYRALEQFNETSDLYKAMVAGSTESLFLLQCNCFRLVKVVNRELPVVFQSMQITKQKVINLLRDKLVLVIDIVGKDQAIFEKYSTPGYLLMAELLLTLSNILSSGESQELFELRKAQYKKWYLTGIKYLYVAKALLPWTPESIKAMYGEAKPDKRRPRDFFYRPDLDRDSIQSYITSASKAMSKQQTISIGLASSHAMQLSNDIIAESKTKQPLNTNLLSILKKRIKALPVRQLEQLNQQLQTLFRDKSSTMNHDFPR